jgi:hypothetical protein
MTPPKPHDLNALASNAQRELAHAQVRRDALQQQKKRQYPWFRMAGAALVAGLFVLSASDAHVKRFWLGVSERQQEAEMAAALAAAKAAIDSAQSTTGEWPSQVPLPALAALVELQNPGPQYRLLARTDHWLLTMTPSGDLQKTQP